MDPFFGAMNEDEYRARQRAGAIGGSALSTIYTKSAAHYVESRSRPSSAAMRFGTAAHTLILEPHEWTGRYLVTKPIQRRTFEDPIKTSEGWSIGDGSACYKTKRDALAAMGADRPWSIAGSPDVYRTKAEALAQLEAQANGRELVTQDTEIELIDLCDKVWRRPVASRLLRAQVGQDIGSIAFEHAMLWRDIDAGVDCSGKIDAFLQVENDVDLCGLQLKAGEGIGMDLKTTGKTIHADAYARRCIDSGWHMQAAHYMAGAAASGKQIDRWIMVVVESVKPYGVRVIELSREFLALGKYQRGVALQRWRSWLDHGHGVAAYDVQPLLVDPPAWALPADYRADVWQDWIAGVEKSDRGE